MTIYVHQGDLPDDVTFTDSVAVDCEMMGLNFFRDRLCLVQLSAGNGDAHLVQIAQGQETAPNLKKLLEADDVLKIFHYGRLDLSTLNVWLGIETAPVYCTKIASKLCRTFTDKHGLKELCKEFLNVELNKQITSTDWGAAVLTPDQQQYAADDVLYLHKIKAILDDMLAREGRTDLAQACFDFLPIRAAIDLAGWNDIDIFAH